LSFFSSFQKLKIEIACYKKNLDFWRFVQKSVMEGFTKISPDFSKSKKLKVVTEI